MIAILAGASFAACGGSTESGSPLEPESETGLPETDPGLDADPGFDVAPTDGTVEGFEVTPSALQTITVPVGSMSPTVVYTAASMGAPANAAWGVDPGAIATSTPGP